MATRPVGLVLDAVGPGRLGAFWAAVLGWQQPAEEQDGPAIEAPDGIRWADGGTPQLRFEPTAEPKAGQNRLHLDLVSADERHQSDTVQRLLALGGREIDIGQGDVPWVVLADPEGNELCVLEPREDYRGIRDLAAVVLGCQAPQRLATFWSEATGWPVLEASPRFAWLQHPSGTATRLELLAVPEPALNTNRVRLHVAPHGADDLDKEVARLEAAGGRVIDRARADRTTTVLADPEGNELHVLATR
jgi:predicted enzyme related to lactoylglutathione lyase